MRVQELQKKVAAQQETNDALLARNNALQAEVQDLKSGTDAIEERARGELGMIREGAIYVQILKPTEREPQGKTPKITERKGERKSDRQGKRLDVRVDRGGRG